MKKQTLLIAVVLCLYPFAATWEGGHSISDGHAAKGFHFSSLSVSESLMPGDLDVRDSQNRSISDPSEISRIAELFSQSMVDLVLKASPALARQTDDGLILLSHLLLNAFFASSVPVILLQSHAAWRASERVVHIVHNLWISLSVGGFLMALAYRRFRLHPSLIPLPLRC